MNSIVIPTDEKAFLKGGVHEVEYRDTGDVVMVTLTEFGEAMPLVGSVVAVTDPLGNFIREWAYILEPVNRWRDDFNEEAYREAVVKEVRSWDIEHAVVVFKDEAIDDVETLFETSTEKSLVITCTGTFPLREGFIERTFDETPSL